MEQPFFKTRSIETDITIANGATVVMGGLITEERKSMEDKIPYLGDIPWIGRFFRSRSEWSNKRNLLIFVTARLVDPMGRQISMGVSEGDAADGEDAKVLMNDLIASPEFSAILNKYGMTFTVNPSYRHIAILKTGSDKVELTPPHDILTQPIAGYLPKGEGAQMLYEIMSESWKWLKNHPINVQRRAAGKTPANSLWFWGQGGAVVLSSFEEKFGHNGDAITAVPLVAGIAELAMHTALRVVRKFKFVDNLLLGNIHHYHLGRLGIEHIHHVLFANRLNCVYFSTFGNF
jgi:hypothetical protein